MVWFQLIICGLNLVFVLSNQTKSKFFSELEAERQRGELRKACSKYGHAIQPLRRVFTKSKLAELRKLMASEVELGTFPVQAYLVTHSDEHQSTDIDDVEKRREYISGFSGDYGDAIITTNKAALWTDGRFHLQADEQIDCNWLLFREGQIGIPTMSEWLIQQLPEGGRIGLNPKLVSEYKWQKLTSELKEANLELVALNVSLIDVIWPSHLRGIKRTKDAFVLDLEYSGETYVYKVNKIRTELQKKGADAMVVTSLDEIAWLLNIRGRDVPYSPFLRSYVILDMTNIFLYVNSSQLTNRKVLENLHLESEFLLNSSPRLRNYSDIWKDLRIHSQLYKKILIPSHCVYSEGASHAIYENVFEEKRLPMQSPIIYLKAKKNPTEKEGMQRANIKDAAAVCDCFAYVEKWVKAGDVLFETEVVTLLNQFRYEQKLSLGNSFRTIVAFGLNAAFPNYEPTPNTDTRIFSNSTLVLDSGGQYLEGTTDVTRTLHFGSPTDDMKEAYTRVLKGLIALSTLTFPSNMKIAMADILARASLWDVGLDYLHETGHGVGAFLGVRESPIKVHFDSHTSMTQVFEPGYFLSNAPIKVHFDSHTSMTQVFEPGYFLSNEPGYYLESDFGIRLENIIEVVEKPELSKGGQTFLGFKVITLVPFEPNLMIFKLLSPQERKWLNNYNEQIREKVGRELEDQSRQDGYKWMIEKTKYIPEIDE